MIDLTENFPGEFNPNHYLVPPTEQSDAHLLRREIRRKNKRHAGARGDHNRRILFSRIEGDREISFHATKGWRNNRKS